MGPWLSPETCIPRVISFSLMTLNTIDHFQINAPSPDPFPELRPAKQLPAWYALPCLLMIFLLRTTILRSFIHLSQWQLCSSSRSVAWSYSCFLSSFRVQVSTQWQVLIIYTLKRNPESHQFTPLPYCRHDFSLESLPFPLNWSSVSIVCPLHSLQNAKFIHKLDPTTPHWE